MGNPSSYFTPRPLLEGASAHNLYTFKELETIEHLFFHCTKVCMFWDELKVVFNSLNIIVRFDIKDVLFGILDTGDISILVNCILLESKFFIYHCKLNKGSLCMRLLVDKVKKKSFQTERFIAETNNKIHFHEKMETFTSINTSCLSLHFLLFALVFYHSM